MNPNDTINMQNGKWCFASKETNSEVYVVTPFVQLPIYDTTLYLLLRHITFFATLTSPRMTSYNLAVFVLYSIFFSSQYKSSSIAH